MAIQTTTSNIGYSLFIMLFAHLVLAMAAITIPFRTPGRMAITAISFCRTVVNWKLVIKISITPGTGAVTI
jgi:hypothetical protein